MTSTEQRLSELLHQATDHTTGDVSFAAVARRVHRHRWLTSITAAIGIVAVTAGVVVAGNASSGLSHIPATARSKEPPRSARQITFQDVAVQLPAGWQVANPGCGWPGNHTVVINDRSGPQLYCPATARPATLPTSLVLTTIYGPQYADSWTGGITIWHGQPAWLAMTTRQGVTTVTLTLPWLNVAASAESPSAATARGLLTRLSARTVSALPVPATASSIFVQSLAGSDGDHQRRNVTIRDGHDVKQLLADLRSLRPATAKPSSCNGTWWPDTVLLTVHDGAHQVRTYAAQFGACGQVTAATGTAATTSGQLLKDIEHLLPNSGL